MQDNNPKRRRVSTPKVQDAALQVAPKAPNPAKSAKQVLQRYVWNSTREELLAETAEEHADAGCDLNGALSVVAFGQRYHQKRLEVLPSDYVDNMKILDGKTLVNKIIKMVNTREKTGTPPSPATQRLRDVWEQWKNDRGGVSMGLGRRCCCCNLFVWERSRLRSPPPPCIVPAHTLYWL